MNPLEPRVLLVIVVLWIVILVGVAAVVRELLTQLKRAKSQIRLRQLWARERRGDLARLVSLFVYVLEATDDDSEHERLAVFEKALRKQAEYVGIEWAYQPGPTRGLEPPEKLTRIELAEMLGLSKTLEALGRVGLP